MMTAEQLKNSIYQLAIEGKLVDQKIDEGTGKELFKEIQIEKKKLIKEGKLKKHKLLPEITEDKIPFDIPNSWEWVNLGELISVVSGVSYKKGDVQKSGIRILRGGNLSNMEVTTEEDDVFLPSEYYDQQKQVQIGDILIVASTGSKTVIGKPGFIDRDLPNTMIGAFLRICRPVTLELASFLKLLFGGEYYRKHIRDLSQGTNINNVKEEYITNFIIPLPPLAEQKRIVAKIEELLPFVEQYAVASTKLNTLNATFPEMMKKSILQEAVQGKLVPQDPNDEPASLLLKKIAEEKKRLIREGKIKKQKPLPEITEDEIPFDIPESWEWVRLSDICNVSDGTHQTPKYVDVGMPFISAQNIKPYRFMPEVHRFVSYEDYLEYNKNVSPEKGDILMTRVGAGIGEAAIIDKDLEFSIYVSLTLIKGYSEELNMKYILNVLNSPLGMALAKKKTLGKGASQGNLNLIFIREFLLPLPPKEEQKRINDKIEIFLPLYVNLNR